MKTLFNLFSAKPMANNHLNGRGCEKCWIERKPKSLSLFLEQAVKTHGKRYDYSDIDYKNTEEKIKIGCPKHGLFFQSPHSHLQGHGNIKTIDDILRKELLQC